MSAFYETELETGKDEESLVTSRNYDEEDRLAVPQNRGVKKPSKEKAKEKLWESIVS